MSEVASWLDTVGRIFQTIPDLATPEQVERGLREILEDPTLELFWWDWERGTYVDVHDVPAQPAVASGRVLTRVEYETRRVGAIVHDPRLLETPEFLESFVPTMRIAMERDRLHRDLVAKLEQLKASRLRIVEAGDRERRRLERNLHDGAQQQLVVARIDVRALERRLAHDTELSPRVERVAEALDGAIEDLRELARGLHPHLLARKGLEAALRAGVARSSLPVDVDVRLEGPLPPAVEAAAYYVCAEAVTNAVKHAQASCAWLSVEQGAGTLTVEVRDDGVGGAGFGPADATGLDGLRDRVEALDGVLEIDSPAGAGTRLVATFPILL